MVKKPELNCYVLKKIERCIFTILNRRTFIYQLGIASAAVLLPFSLWADDKKPCELVFDELRKYIKNVLGIDLNDSFYSEWKEGYQHYVYVSEATGIKRPADEPYFRFFGSEVDKAELAQKELIAKGFHTMLYRTAATSAAKLYSPLANYPYHCLSFIAFHEAHHLHRKANGRKAIPYSFEEAAGDVLGNYVSIDFALQFPHLMDIKNVKHQIKVNEKLYKKINATRKKIDDGKSADKAFKKLENFIARLLKNEDNFKKDRFLYPINNAFFIRYGYYTSNYFLLKALFNHAKSPVKFLAYLDTMPESETEAIDKVKAILKGEIK